VQASARIKGVVLHRILESVMGPEDLHASVEKAVEDGQLGREQAEEAESMLAGAIASVADRGWFPGDPRRILDEREIFTAEGEELTLRPDRVVIDGDSVQIVDYKFGAPKRSHVRQVAGYMRLYRAMGWNKVAGFIWYVEAGDVVSVEEDPYLF
jgi:RecB family exonuclease